ncbi:TetR/AcrR family transcriptional regulator [Streptomyces sp. NPDC058603]|uniref:TetR/AcrR family transcriptional regulator n=1 Tax=Streptomyces sp. NPDC058603 TaxID=3346551 RepID=UPI00366853ED
MNEPTQRPGGRSARVRAAVHQAVIELLSQPDVNDLTIPAVAQRAGVNPTSIYRRWGSREALLADVAVTRMEGAWPLADTGTLRGDLVQWATNGAASLVRADGQLILRALALSLPGTPQAQADRREHLRRRADALQDILSRAAERGEFPPPLDEVLDHLLAPLYLRALFGHMPPGPAYPQELVDRLLDGGSARRTGGPRRHGA